MNHSFKAAVLTGLVFPGLGQLVLKQYRRAAVLAVAFSALLLGIVVTLSRRAMVLLDQIQWEDGFIDLSTITEAVTRAAQPSDDRFLHGLFLALLACWIVGVADAFLTGRKQDRAERSKDRAAQDKP
jgi:hypothetical protein